MKNLTLTRYLALSKSKHGKYQKSNQLLWEMRFTNVDVNKKVNLFNKTIRNIILNYIPHEKNYLRC